MELTQANIRAALPGDILRDADVKGLHLRVGAERSSYYLYYRTRDHRERRPKLGDSAALTLGQARSIAKAMLARIAQGDDPMGEVLSKRGASKVTDLAARYVAEHLPKKKASSALTDRRMLDKEILPLLGKLRVPDVTQDDIGKLHARIGKRGTVQANRVLALLSKMFALAERWKMRPIGTNPCMHIARFRERPRRRYMTQDEVRRVTIALAELRPTRRLSVDFILLLMLTGARKGELAAAQWEHYKGDRLELPEELVKTQARTIFLPPQAQAIIRQLPVIPGRTILQIKNPMDCWIKARAMAEVPDLHLHDLRHSFASILLNQGYGLEQIGQLLGHTQMQTTKRYAHLMDEKAIEAAGNAGAQLTEWMGTTD